MIKIICIGLLVAVATVSTFKYSTVSVVTIAGAIIKSNSVTVIEKYKRKDCPVCKGKGWYISGDGIKKVDYSSLAGFLIQVNKEQQVQLEKQQYEINEKRRLLQRIRAKRVTKENRRIMS